MSEPVGSYWQDLVNGFSSKKMDSRVSSKMPRTSTSPGAGNKFSEKVVSPPIPGAPLTLARRQTWMSLQRNEIGHGCPKPVFVREQSSAFCPTLSTLLECHLIVPPLYIWIPPHSIDLFILEPLYDNGMGLKECWTRNWAFWVLTFTLGKLPGQLNS